MSEPRGAVRASTELLSIGNHRSVAAMPDLLSRFLHARAILKRPIISSVAGLLGLLGLLVLIRDEFMPVEWRETLKMEHLLQPIFSIQWYWFVLAALITILFGAIEGSYRLHRANVWPRFTTKPIMSNILLLKSNGDEPLRIIFWCAETIPILHIVLEYSLFVMGRSWTAPRHIHIATLDYVIHGSRNDLLLMYREQNMGIGCSVHWGGPLKQGELLSDIISGGIYRARVRFIGANPKHHQNYYFLLSAFQAQENEIRLVIFPHSDLSFVNEWEIGKI